MAAKKTKSKSPARGVVGLLKKIVKGKSSSAPPRPTEKTRQVKAKKAKPEAKVKPEAKAKPTPKPLATNGKRTKGSSKAGEAAPADTAVVVEIAIDAGAPPVKKKPPSITITRPEVTRPPVVLPPPRPVEAPVGAPSILVPKDGTLASSLTPMLRWMYVGGATEYEVEWSADAHFGRGRSGSAVAQQTAITLDESNQLKPSTNYKWRVRGGNEAGWGPWSHSESFRSPDK